MARNKLHQSYGQGAMLKDDGPESQLTTKLLRGNSGRRREISLNKEASDVLAAGPPGSSQTMPHEDIHPSKPKDLLPIANKHGR